MAITSVYPTFNPYVGNPAADQLRRENQRREVIEPVAQMERNAAEKGVISEDKSRNGPQSSVASWQEDGKSRQTELKQAVEGRQQSGEQNSGQSAGDGSGADTGDQSKDGQQAEQQSSGQQTKQQQIDQQKLAELKKRDAEVRAHEQAHATVGGSLAGAPSYQYERGPDGQQYAVAGEVPIDVAPVAGDPRATIDKMQQVRAAALAPAEPSAADRRIASEAQQQQLAAQAELVQQMAQMSQDSQTIADDPWFIADDNPADPWALPYNDGRVAGASADSAMWQAEVSSQANPAFKASDNEQPWSGQSDVAAAMTVVSQRSLESSALMQKRNEVIDQFYRSSVVATERPLRLTA